MKACIVSLNAKYVHLSPAPYALGAGVRAYAKLLHEVAVLDATVGQSEEGLLSAIAEQKPSLVGFCAYIWNITAIRHLLPRLKRLLPEAVIVLGGPEVSYTVGQVLADMLEVDCVLSGEGERPFAQLLDALEEGKSASDVPGCGYRRKDGTLNIPTPYIGEGTPPSPLDFGYAEALRGRIAYIEGSRGCPFSCAFCLSGRAGGVRYFDILRVKRDILRLAACGSRTVKFVDRTFNADSARARELWRFIMEKRAAGEIPAGVCFHFEIAGELLDGESFALLAGAPRGLFQMEIGLQSFSVETLRAIHRPPVTGRLTENIRRLVAMGNIHIHIDLIAGLPGEDLSSFRAGFDRAFALGAHMLQLGILKLLHGAPMREKSDAYPCKHEKEPPYRVTETPSLSEAALHEISLCEEGCERLYNSGKYLHIVKECLRFGDTPFDLLRDVGAALLTLRKPYTLDDEVGCLFAFFAERLSPERARDLLLLDVLCHNPSCYIPKVLRREDGALAALRRRVDGEHPRRAGVRRAYGILYTEGVAVWVDYDTPDPITGEYRVFRN